MCSKIDHQSYCKEAEEIQVENHSDLLVFFVFARFTCNEWSWIWLNVNWFRIWDILMVEVILGCLV